MITTLLLTATLLARQGCCSHHGGIDYCDTSVGRYVCNDGTYSPSCGCRRTAPRPTIVQKAPAYIYVPTRIPTPTPTPTAQVLGTSDSSLGFTGWVGLGAIGYMVWRGIAAIFKPSEKNSNQTPEA
jgi:hypothetical protein